MSAAASGSTLLFNWQPPRPRKLSIVMFVCASALVHAFCFYLFQIVYAPAVVLLPPPAKVSLITSSSEEGRTMLRWIDAEDPALGVGHAASARRATSTTAEGTTRSFLCGGRPQTQKCASLRSGHSHPKHLPAGAGPIAATGAAAPIWENSDPNFDVGGAFRIRDRPIRGCAFHGFE